MSATKRAEHLHYNKRLKNNLCSIFNKTAWSSLVWHKELCIFTADFRTQHYKQQSIFTSQREFQFSESGQKSVSAAVNSTSTVQCFLQVFPQELSSGRWQIQTILIWQLVKIQTLINGLPFIDGPEDSTLETINTTAGPVEHTFTHNNNIHIYN